MVLMRLYFDWAIVWRDVIHVSWEIHNVKCVDESARWVKVFVSLCLGSRVTLCVDLNTLQAIF
jgi:hypothetical protein